MGTDLKKVLLIGGGGHAVSVLEMAGNNSMFLGYVDKKEREDIGIPYLGNDDWVLENYLPDKYMFLLGSVYSDKVNTVLRQILLEKYRHYSSPVLVAQSAIITSNAILGDGTVVFEHGLVNHAVVGKHCVINSGSIVEHNCCVEDNVFVGPGAIVGGHVKIEKNVFIGSGAVIRDGITIESDAVIGMGAVVTRDVTEKGLYYGNPAKLMKK